MSTEKLNIYQKLLAIQKHVVGLAKDKKAFGYSYVTGDKVLEFIKPLMNDNGLLLKQEVLSIENTRQDYKTKSGETSEINSKVMMKFTWIDADSGEKEECLFGANGQNAWDKGVGSALTYGERYFLLKFFHIATDEDDIDNPDRKPEPVSNAKPQTKKQTIPPTDLPKLESELLNCLTVEDLKLLKGSYIEDIKADVDVKAMFNSRYEYLTKNNRYEYLTKSEQA